MALKKRVSSLKDVPAQFQDLYKKEGAGYILDLEKSEDEEEDEGEEKPDDTEAQRRVKEFRNENIRLKKELEATKKELGKFDPEAYEAAMKAAESARNEEERALLQKGRFDEVMNRRLAALQADRQKSEERFKEQITTLSSESEMLRKKLHKDRVRTMLREAADQMKIQLVPTGTTDFYARGLSVFNGLNEDGEPVALDGEDIRYNKDQKPYSAKDFLTDLVEQAPHLVAGASGTQSGGPGKRGARGGTLEVDINDIKGFGNNLEKIASGQVEVRVPGLGS